MKTRVPLAIAVLALAAIAFYVWNKSKAEDNPSQASSATTTVGDGPIVNTPSTEATAKSRLEGSVLQADGQALAAASVQLVPHKKQSTRLGAHDAITASSADGTWTLENIPPGEYVLSASAMGFLPSQKEVLVEANNDLRALVLKLTPGGQTLSGEVRDLTGGTIEAAIVHVLPMSTSGIDREHSASAQTDQAGHYELNLLPGRYLVQAMHTDYVPRSEVIEVSSGAQTLNFGLAPGAVVEGVVRHIESDEVVPGAIVSYATERVSRLSFFSNSVGGGSVVADHEGHFRITGVGSGSLKLTARGDNATTSEPTVVALGIAEHQSEVQLYLSSAFRIAGMVIDEVTKEPVAGIAVSASEGGEGVGANALSNEAGQFEITGLAAGKYRLSGEGGEYLAKLFGDQVLVEANVDDALLALSKGAMIHGRVEPPAVAEIGVDLEEIRGISPNAFRRVMSEADGSFSFGPLDPSSFRLQAKSKEGALGSLDLVLPETGLHDVVIPMKESGSVAGQVVDANGAPVGDVTVKLRRKTGSRSMNILFNGQDMLANSAHTGPGGDFKVVGLKAGTYELRVVDAQGEALRWAGANKEGAATVVAPKEVTLEPQQESEGHLLRVEARTASIAGVVMGPDGRPAPDVWVTASAARQMPRGMPEMPGDGGPPPQGGPPQGDEDQVETRSTVMMVVQDDGGDEGGGPGLDLGRGGELPPVLTNEKGEFRIEGLRAGKYDLIAEGMRGSARGFSDGAQTGEPATIRLQTLTRIEGTVTLGGEPATNFVVELSGTGRRDKRVRDKEGRFTMHRIDPGSYTVKVRSEQGEAEAEVQVAAGKATKVQLNMEMLTRVRGTLLDEEGSPVVGAIVTPVPRTDNGSMNLMIGDDAETTGRDGSFEFGVRPGKYLLIALKPGAGPLARQPLDVAAGEEAIDVGTLRAKPGAGFGPPPGDPGTPQDEEEETR